MIVDTRKAATVIPLAAIQRGAQGTIVYVVKEDKTTAVRVVKMGAAENDNVAIESGIEPGEVVVTDGIDRLREGAKVEVTAPFVPKARGPGSPGGGSGRGQWAGKGGGKGEGKGDGKGDGKPAEGAPAAPPSVKPAEGKAADAKPADAKQGENKAAPIDGKAPAAASVVPPKVGAEAPKSGGGFRDMTNEQKAEFRKRMEGMTDEQKAEFRKKAQDRRQQQGQ